MTAAARIAALVIVVLPALTANVPVVAQAPSAPRFDVASLKERDRDVPLGLVGVLDQPGRPSIVVEKVMRNA